MKRWVWLVLVGVCTMMIVGMSAKAEGLLIGGGGHYWTVIDDIDTDNLNDDGVAYFVSVQARMAEIFKLGVDVERFPEDFIVADEDVYAPQAYITVGTAIYAGIGIGKFYADGEWSEDPFYNIRAGLDLEVIPSLFLDINANYRFMDWESTDTLDDDVSGETITLGAALRIEL